MFDVLKGVLKSRKNVLAILAVIAATAGRFGYNWDAATMFVVIAPFLTAIFGIAYEDGKQKGAGAGITTRTLETSDGGLEVTATPDPTGKP